MTSLFFDRLERALQSARHFVRFFHAFGISAARLRGKLKVGRRAQVAAREIACPLRNAIRVKSACGVNARVPGLIIVDDRQKRDD